MILWSVVAPMLEESVTSFELKAGITVSVVKKAMLLGFATDRSHRRLVTQGLASHGLA